jgi:hypothetical protein
MLKRLCLAFAGLFALVSIAQGAGTVPGFSLTPQFDLTGKVAPGCKLFVYQAGTVATPQNAYQDTGLASLQPNPLTCDAAGRLPQWFVADGTIKLKLTDKLGNQIFVGDNLLVIGPSSGGGGGGGTVDPTTILGTGDIKIVYNTGVYTGFVRANGRTIGSSTSGATERANADCQSLFSFLWGNDPNLSVSGGRGASSAADWAANKTIALPDFRGLAPVGLDDMGNTSRGVYTGVTFSTGTATTLGSVVGTPRTTLITANLPPYTPAGTMALSVTSSVANVQVNSNGNGSINNPGGSTSWPVLNNSAINSTGTGTLSGTPQGGTSTPVQTVSPIILITYLLKL